MPQVYGRELNHREDEVGRRDVLFRWGLVPPKFLAFSSGRGMGVEADIKSGPLILDGLSSLPGLNTVMAHGGWCLKHSVYLSQNEILPTLVRNLEPAIVKR